MRFTDLYGNAKFIAPSDAACESPYIRKEIEVSKIESAQITICGLGFFELFINGKRVENDLFIPANSLYRHRNNNGMEYHNRDENYTLKDVVSPKGENIRGERFMEFYLDQQDFQKIILDIFYKEKVSY